MAQDIVGCLAVFVSLYQLETWLCARGSLSPGLFYGLCGDGRPRVGGHALRNGEGQTLGAWSRGRVLCHLFAVAAIVSWLGLPGFLCLSSARSAHRESAPPGASSRTLAGNPKSWRIGAAPRSVA